MVNKFKEGQKVEIWVAKKLKNLGYRILAMGWYGKYGEIDIVCVEFNNKNHCLVFVEVKARTSTKYGLPYEAVNNKKLEKIRLTGESFRNHWNGKVTLPEATRIDVASVILDKEGLVRSWKLMKNVTR